MSKSVDKRPDRQAHRNFMRNYWKNIARKEDTQFQYSQENINRMSLGKAPRRLACLRHKKTGALIEFHAPLELHHVFGSNNHSPQEDQTIIELYPWQHDLCDPDRHFPFEFVEWRGFQ